LLATWRRAFLVQPFVALTWWNLDCRYWTWPFVRQGMKLWCNWLCCWFSMAFHLQSNDSSRPLIIMLLMTSRGQMMKMVVKKFKVCFYVLDDPNVKPNHVQVSCSKISHKMCLHINIYWFLDYNPLSKKIGNLLWNCCRLL